MRLIYSLRFDLEPSKPGTTLELIAPVDQEGQSRYCRPLNRNKRLVDLGPGEHILHRGKIYRIQRVEPYRWHPLADEVACSRHDTREGFMSSGDPA